MICAWQIYKKNTDLCPILTNSERWIWLDKKHRVNEWRGVEDEPYNYEIDPLPFPRGS